MLADFRLTCNIQIIKLEWPDIKVISIGDITQVACLKLPTLSHSAVLRMLSSQKADLRDLC